MTIFFPRRTRPHLPFSFFSQNLFLTLDSLLEHADYPAYARLEALAASCKPAAGYIRRSPPCLTPTAFLAHLDHICDVRGAADVKAYRLNQDRLLQFLAAKVGRLCEALDGVSGIAYAASAHSSNYVARNASSTANSAASNAQKLRYAVGA